MASMIARLSLAYFPLSFNNCRPKTRVIKITIPTRKKSFNLKHSKMRFLVFWLSFLLLVELSSALYANSFAFDGRDNKGGFNNNHFYSSKSMVQAPRLYARIPGRFYDSSRSNRAKSLAATRPSALSPDSVDFFDDDQMPRTYRNKQRISEGFSFRSLAKPFIIKKISDAMEVDLLKIQLKINHTFPEVYDIDDRKTLNLYQNLPELVRPIFRWLVSAQSNFLHIAKAMRSAVVLTINEFFTSKYMEPIIDGIAESILDTVPENFQLKYALGRSAEDTSNYISNLHRRIMERLENEKIEQIIDIYTNGIGHAVYKATKKFFMLVMEPPVTKFHQWTQEVDENSIEALALQFAPVDRLASLSAESLSRFVQGMAFATTGMTKQIVETVLLIPPVRRRINVEIEKNLLRAWHMNWRPSHLPVPVYSENLRFVSALQNGD